MNLSGKTVGFALTGSHCTFEQIIPVIQAMVDKGASVIPIVSEAVLTTDTRFGKAEDWIGTIERITRQKCITTIAGAEPVGPKKLLDVLVIAPCSGNTISKLANAITDTPVLMAAKAQMRNQRPVVLAISTNDGLGLNGVNIGRLWAVKNIYMVPFGQDDPSNKTTSLVADMRQIVNTVEAALDKKQLQPMVIEVYNRGHSNKK